jgi:hypothetical protein
MYILMILFRILVVVLAVTLCWLLYSYIYWKNHNQYEGLSETSCTAADVLVMSKTNAADIVILKEKVDTLLGLKAQVDKVQQQTDGNTQAITSLGKQQVMIGEDVTNGATAGSEAAGPTMPAGPTMSGGPTMSAGPTMSGKPGDTAGFLPTSNTSPALTQLPSSMSSF